MLITDRPSADVEALRARLQGAVFGPDDAGYDDHRKPWNRAADQRPAAVAFPCTDADVIAFCGVRFMAQTAKILSPDKIVVLPDMDAGCSLEDSCPPDQFAAFRAKHPDHIALTYINCSTEVKALSDVIVTSSSPERFWNFQ